MTIVLDDPSLWPLISVEITTSYVSGSWRVTLKTVLVKLTLHVYDCVFAVIFFAAVVYDWGQQDNTY
jgi:hypothetical protein